MTRERWEQILFAHVSDEVVQDMLNEYVLELESSNAKLREVVNGLISKYKDEIRDYWGGQEPLPCDLCGMERQCRDVPKHDRCLFYKYLRELGVELDDGKSHGIEVDK